MEKRTLMLFGVMITLFAIYLAVSLQAMPVMTDKVKAQTELFNSMDQEVKSPADTD